MSKVIIDGDSSENIVSKASVKTKASVKALGLKTEPHPTPYRIAWIKKGAETHVNERCRVPSRLGSSTKMRFFVML